MKTLKKALALLLVLSMSLSLMSVAAFADGEIIDEPATVEEPAAEEITAVEEAVAEAVATASEALETLASLSTDDAAPAEEVDASTEAIEAAAAENDLDALSAIVEAAAASAKAGAETAAAAAEKTQTASETLTQQIEDNAFESVADETVFEAVDEESGEVYETTTGQVLVETAQAAANAAVAAAQNAGTASENAANAADAAQYALENADEPATEEQQQIVDTAKEAAADAADKAETAKAAAAEVEAVIETATATAEEAAEIVAKAADAAKDAAAAANNAAVAAKDAADTIAVIRNVDETHTEDEVSAAKSVVAEKVERAVELAKVADEKAAIAKEAAERAKDVTLSGEEKAQAIKEAAAAAQEATDAANEAADAASEAAEAAYSLAEQKGWPFYSKVVTAKGVIVTARAQAGVFPKGTELTVADMTAEQAAEQMDVAARDVVTAVDINFWFEGRKIQPDTSVGLVDVTITDPNAEAVPTAVKTVKDGVTETLAVEVEDGVAMFEAEHFTAYATVQDSSVASFTNESDVLMYADTLKEAIDGAKAGTTVTLLKDYDAATKESAMYTDENHNSSRHFGIRKSLTIEGAAQPDGKYPVLQVKGRGFFVGGIDSDIDVTFKNITILNSASGARCIDTRGKLNSLTLDHVTLKTDGAPSGYTQPLTIGGNQSTAATVTIQNGSLIQTNEDAKAYYAIITFNPVNMTIDNSTIKGWACIYAKGNVGSAGSAGSVFTIRNNSTLVSTNEYNGETNSFSMFVAEDDNVTFNVTDTTIQVNANSDQHQGIACTEKENVTVNLGSGNDVTLTGDNAVIGFNSPTITITGGTFNDPSVANYITDDYYAVPLGNGTYEVRSGVTTINATAATAQDILDGRFGNINGKTINFTESVDTVLELARPTKYRGSGTTYYNYVNSVLQETPTAWSENISSVMNSHSHYYRTLSNVTFTANNGVTLAGFSFSASHVASSGHDYVRDVEQTSGVTYYKHSSLNNITFQGLKIVGNAEFKLYLEGTTVSNVTFDGCDITATGANKTESNAAIKFLADSQYFTNIIVKNCNLHDVYQGVYVSGIDGLTIQNNRVDTTVHNAFALQSHSNPVKGTVVIEENYVVNAGDRAIRFNGIGAGANITINNNVFLKSAVASASESDVIKDGSIATGAVIDLEHNYWNGVSVNDAVKGTLPKPTTVGLIAGTFPVDVTAYCAAGYVARNNGNGTYTVIPVYTVTWQNWNGATLETDLGVQYGTTPVYNSATPTRADSGSYYFVFSGWSPVVSAVTGNVTYTAQFTQYEYSSDSDDSDDDTPTVTPTTTPQTTTIEEEATPLAALPENLAEVTVAMVDAETGETVEVAVSELPNVFVDVAEDSYARDAIAYAAALGLMNGVGSNADGEATFAPTAATTGDMLATILYRATSGETTSGENWAEAATAWAADNNLAEGMGIEELSQLEVVSREQMVTVMYRVAEARGFDVSFANDLVKFNDADELSDYARVAMEWAVSVGLIKGTSKTTLSPTDDVTREQIALILMRFNELTKNVV